MILESAAETPLKIERVESLTDNYMNHIEKAENTIERMTNNPLENFMHVQADTIGNTFSITSRRVVLNMVKAEYKHPNYTPEQSNKKILKNEPQHKIVRMEFPDGVIVVFELTGESIAVHSNYNYSFNTDTNIISPKLDSPNNNFRDFT